MGRGGISRRGFLKACLSGVGGLALGCAAVPTEPGSRAGRNLVDAHVHLWSADTVRYPRDARASARVLHPDQFGLESWLRCSRHTDVGRAVFVQTGCYANDNRLLLEALAARPDILAGVASIEVDGDLPARLDELAAQGVRGIRLTAYRSCHAWPAREDMATLWRAAAERGLAMCLLTEPRWLRDVDRLCERFPETTVVLDHFARVGWNGALPEPEIRELTALARHPNVYVKASGFHYVGRRQAPYMEALELLYPVVRAFGPERVMWGSDSPHQLARKQSYDASVQFLTWHAEELTDREREWILGRTAEKVFFPS